MSAYDFYLFLQKKGLSLENEWKEWKVSKEVKSLGGEKNVYTDGAVKNNKNASKENLKGGIGVYSSDYNYNVSESFENASNNKAELRAILKALQLLEKEEKQEKTIIWSDSIYSIKCCTIWYKKWMVDGWKTSKGSEVLNQDLIKQIVYHLEKMKHISLKWIEGHNGNEGNEMADKLAVKAIES